MVVVVVAAAAAAAVVEVVAAATVVLVVVVVVVNSNMMMMIMMMRLIIITTTITMTTTSYRRHDAHRTGEVPILESRLPLEGARVWCHFLCSQSLTQQFGSLCWRTDESDLVRNANVCK